MNHIVSAEVGRVQDLRHEDRRQSDRRRILESGVVFTDKGRFDCQVIDLSSGGVRVRPVEPLPDDAGSCRFQLARIGVFEGAIRWRAGDAVGLAFETAPDDVAQRCRVLLG